MNDARRLILLGKHGELLETTIQAALIRLAARAVRQFPALKDDVALVEVLEEAGRRIVARQERAGPLANLHGYAWVTVRSVATSFMRRGSVRLTQKTLEPGASEALLTAEPAVRATPQQVEQRILLRQILGRLSAEERRICLWKQAGFSSFEISHLLGRSVPSVDTVYSRAKCRLRQLLSSSKPGGEQWSKGK
ncbi:MAG: sigma-70 family RNA polymerase sigma factor [Acidobacteriota bacterium]|nr:sigma-70 family RNA polymerase sigma factor [Acidobacteriota bacterium]